MPTRRQLLLGSLAALASSRMLGPIGACLTRAASPPPAVDDLKPLTRRILPQVAADPALGEPGVVSDVASGASLRVVSREEWGADESIRFDESGEEIWAEMFVPARILVVHHTATRNDYELEDVPAELNSIYDFHTLVQGWGDIAYHALIDRFGNIYEGRHGRGGDPGDAPGPREVLGHSVVGGHCKFHEYGSIGVALLGDATEDDWAMTEPAGPMWEALVRYCSFESRRHFLKPLAPAEGGAFEAARSDFLRSDNAWSDKLALITEHRAIEETFCPGDPVIALLPELRAAVFGAALGTSRSGVRVARVEPESREPSVGTTVTFRWGAEPLDPGWRLMGYEYAVEGWFKPDDREPIDYLSGYTGEPQPKLRWIAVDAGTAQHSFVPGSPGQYTLHVRVLIAAGQTSHRAAYAGSATILARP